MIIVLEIEHERVFQPVTILRVDEGLPVEEEFYADGDDLPECLRQLADKLSDDGYSQAEHEMEQGDL